MIRPAYLKKGDTVAIVSTARKISIGEITPAIDLLKKWQLKVKIGATIGKTNHQFAGFDDDRKNDFQNALDDPNIAAIWCARGGYGTVRIIDQLDFSNFLKQPKWIIGYSDITVLHSELNVLGVQSIHGTMPINITDNTENSIESLRQALFGHELSYKVPLHPSNRTGRVAGELIGGNLSILYSLMGSKSSVETENKILFIEDLDEYLYHIDRMLINVKRNGWFDGLNGLIVGGMTKMNDNEIPFGKNAIEIIREITASHDFPIAFDFPAGHLDDNRALIMGERVSLDVGTENTILSFQTT